MHDVAVEACIQPQTEDEERMVQKKPIMNDVDACTVEPAKPQIITASNSC